MTETVKVYWDGARKYGVATKPGQAQFFEPGLNNVPKDVWKDLTGDPTCSVNIHLKGGMLRVASDEVQVESNIGKLGADAAVELIVEMMDEASVLAAREQEQGRSGGPRKDVMAAIDAHLAKFRAVEEGLKEDGKSPSSAGGSDRKGSGGGRGSGRGKKAAL